MSSKLTIGFLGAGKMATALAGGFVRAGLVNAADIVASDPVPAARDAFTKDAGIPAKNILPTNQDILKSASVLILAVKPQQTGELLAELKPHYSPQHLLISIAGGITVAKLEGGLPAGSRVIRVMPNTPALVGTSATGFTLGNAATATDGELVQKLFSAVGISFQVKEPLLDAVTGLSGSGPAYVYLFIEALSDGGVAAGLPRDLATKLAAQTVLGSARMVLETGMHPGVLKDMVTSPGGTTIEGIHELEKNGFRAAVMSAVRAASEKSRKLGQN